MAVPEDLNVAAAQAGLVWLQHTLNLTIELAPAGAPWKGARSVDGAWGMNQYRLDDGDTLLVYRRPKGELASEATGWQLEPTFAAGIGLRIRDDGGEWRVLGIEDPADHTSAA